MRAAYTRAALAQYAAGMEYTVQLGVFTCLVTATRKSAVVTLKDDTGKVIVEGIGESVRAAQRNASEATKDDRARRELDKTPLRDERRRRASSDRRGVRFGRRKEDRDL